MVFNITLFFATAYGNAKVDFDQPLLKGMLYNRARISAGMGIKGKGGRTNLQETGWLWIPQHRFPLLEPTLCCGLVVPHPPLQNLCLWDALSDPTGRGAYT